MAADWEDRGRYGRGGRGYERGRESWRGDRDRDWTDRSGDEVRSWFGDEDAERRRRVEDDRRYGPRDYGRDYRGAYGEDYGGYGGYADRGVGVGGSHAGYDRPRSYGGYGRGGYAPEDERRYRGYYPIGGYGLAGWGMGMVGDPYAPRPDYRGRGYGRSDERDFFDRAGDEVASWFGDEDAERRREMDARHRGRGPKNYTRSDDRIHEDVNDRLSDDPHIDASDIEVSVSGGEVNLDGTVRERFAKRHAEDIAEDVSGVKHVQNNLRIRAQQDGAGAVGATLGTPAGRTGAAGGTTR